MLLARLEHSCLLIDRNELDATVDTWNHGRRVGEYAQHGRASNLAAIGT